MPRQRARCSVSTPVPRSLQLSEGRSSLARSTTELLSVANEQSFQVLREKSRKIVLEAEQRGVAERQREARTARHYRRATARADVTLLVSHEVAGAGKLTPRPKRGPPDP